MTHPQLKRLKIHRYEQFVDVPWIEFSPDENVILGINGAGKTRLLRLIRAVLNFNYEPLLAQDFDVEFELSYGRVELRGRVRSEEATPQTAPHESESLEPQRQLAIRAHATANDLRFELSRDRNQHTLSFPGATTTVVSPAPPPGLVIPWDHTRTLNDPRLSALLPDFGAYYLHEDDRDFQALVSRLHFWLAPDAARRFGIHDAADLPPLLVLSLVRSLAALPRIEEKREGLRYGGTDMLPGARKGDAKSSFAPLLDGLGAETLGFRPKIVQTTDVLDCQGLELRLKFASGQEFADNGLTFGQRRFLMMALLMLFRPSYPVLIDEIDNGLHPRLVEAVLNLASARQSFFTTHNKLVIDYVNYDNAEEIHQKLHICHRDAAGRQTVITLDDAVAKEVYEKVEIGIMHPSDVLRMDGLW